MSCPHFQVAGRESATSAAGRLRRKAFTAEVGEASEFVVGQAAKSSYRHPAINAADDARWLPFV